MNKKHHKRHHKMTIEVHNPLLLIQEKELQRKKTGKESNSVYIKIKTKVK
jgi:hypothetical protein